MVTTRNKRSHEHCYFYDGNDLLQRVKPFKACEKRSPLGTEKKEREKHQKDRICTYVPRDLVH